MVYDNRYVYHQNKKYGYSFAGDLMVAAIINTVGL